MMDIGVVFFGHKGIILDIEQIAQDLGGPVWPPLQTCCFSEFGGHIGFLPGEVGQVSAKMPTIRGFGKNWTGQS